MAVGDLEYALFVRSNDRRRFWGDENSMVLTIGFDVGIQAAFNLERIYELIRRTGLVVSVFLFTMVLTKRKDGVSAKTTSSRKIGERELIV